MKSYAAVDRIEGCFAICEVEQIDVANSVSENYFEHPTAMMDVPMFVIEITVGEVSEHDVLIVEHDSNMITWVHSKSEEEKQRRIQVYDKIFNSK